MAEIDEATLVDALDRLHGKDRWREPYRTKQGENMLRADMLRILKLGVWPPKDR